MSRRASIHQGQLVLTPGPILDGSRSARLKRRGTQATFTFFEFFAGGGMARAGLGSRWTCLFANDFDFKKGSVYAANWGGEALLTKDVGEVKTNEVPGTANLIWA